MSVLLQTITWIIIAVIRVLVKGFIGGDIGLLCGSVGHPRFVGDLTRNTMHTPSTCNLTLLSMVT